MSVEEHTSAMRIRTYRPGDISTLVHLQQSAARVDGLETMDETDFARLLEQSWTRFGYNVFLLTDDDDELNTWGQGETLEGLEGEVIGYTILYPSKDGRAYHFRCYGTVLPAHRQRGAGHALLLCALNHARIQSLDIMAEARQQGLPIFFEAELPTDDAAAARLARTLELTESDETIQPGLRVYRTDL